MFLTGLFPLQIYSLLVCNSTSLVEGVRDLQC